MDRALIIYDLSGKVWSITYGDVEAPQGVPSLWCDIPPGAVVDYVDVKNAKAIFKYLPETDLGKLQKQMQYMLDFIGAVEGTVMDASKDSSDAVSAASVAENAAVEANEKASTNTSDITNIQIALAEVYELLLGGMEA